MPSKTTDSVIELGERILALLDEGNFTATYKYAVLLALMDLCIERYGGNGPAPWSFSTSEVAEKVIGLYWSQTLPFDPLVGGSPPRQNNSGQAEILSAILRFRRRFNPGFTLSAAGSKNKYPSEFNRLVHRVEWKLIEMPLPRLQILGNQEQRFLYDLSWSVHEVHEPALRQRVSSYQAGHDKRFDPTIRLKPGVAEGLVRLNGLLRPLIHRQWAAMVASINRFEDSQLETFLFGSDRIPLDPVRQDLRDLQGNRCFYCGKSLAQAVDVDHFLPWARYPDNGLSNLVVADARCNHAKRDFLADHDHLARWLARASEQAGMLSQVASARCWDYHPSRTNGVAQTIYLGLPDGYSLWREGEQFVPINAARTKLLFSGFWLPAGSQN